MFRIRNTGMDRRRKKMGKKSGDTVPSRYLDSKFKKVTQEIKHYRYLAHTRTCVGKIFTSFLLPSFCFARYQVAGKQTCIFFLLPTASSFLITSLSFWRGGGCTWPRGGMHRGGRGDARASCASPLGTPLTCVIRIRDPADFASKRIRVQINGAKSIWMHADPDPEHGLPPPV